eukprot:1500145-Amphidinium_carterae.1
MVKKEDNSKARLLIPRAFQGSSFGTNLTFLGVCTVPRVPSYAVQQKNEFHKTILQIQGIVDNHAEVGNLDKSAEPPNSKLR